MGISIGRVGLDIDGLQTPLGAGGYKRQGDVLQLQGRMRASSLADGLWLREQLLGLANNPDEPWVRLLWPEAQQASGLYSVEDVSVDSFGLTLTTGGSPYSVTLRRLASYATPTFETLATWGGPMTNGHSATASSFRFAFPAGELVPLQSFVPGAAYSTGGSRPVSGVFGVGLVAYQFTSTASTTYSGPIVWTCPLANVYDGSCRLEVLVDGNYRTLVGRQAPTGVGASWRLTNDVIRVTPSGARLAVSVWDGAAWTTAKEYTWTAAFGGASMQFLHFAVLRNSPDQVIIRCWLGFPAVLASVVTLDVAIVRGTPLAWCTAASGNATTTWTVERSTGEAGANLADLTPVTVGLRANANDAQGDRYVLVSDFGTTITAGSGRIANASARQLLRFGLGLEVNGSSASAPNRATDLASDFLAAPTLKTTVRTR